MHGKEYIICQGNAEILSYKDESILLSTSSGRLQVCGRNLRLDYMAGDRIAIKGYIDAVKYE